MKHHNDLVFFRWQIHCDCTKVKKKKLIEKHRQQHSPEMLKKECGLEQEAGGRMEDARADLGGICCPLSVRSDAGRWTEC